MKFVLIFSGFNNRGGDLSLGDLQMMRNQKYI